MLATDNSVLKELPFHRASGELERDFKMPNGVPDLTALQLKFCERRMVERILGQAVRVRNRTELPQSAVGAIALSHSNCSI